ncbi:MAG: alpha/beta fold hydrolase [Litoreibacter sp.]|nr:alpha/beta fold hydrolase [Litoreibacter sp.]
MSDFLFIHGSCHGAWCWRDVLPLMEELGHSARSIDLPSHGADRSPAEKVSLDDYADAILDAIDRPVVLVGHSMAGFPITAAAEKAPEKISALVYLCAYVPTPGQSLVDMRRAGPSQPLKGALNISSDRKAYTIDPVRAAECFFQDVEPETQSWAVSQLCPQPIEPQDTVLDLSPASTSMPRYYIRTLNDQTIPPEYQETMAAEFDPENIFELETSHSPFLSQPRLLCETLNKIQKALP